MGRHKQKEHPHTDDGTMGVFWVPADTDIPMEYKIITRDLPGMRALTHGWLEVLRSPFAVILHCGCRTVLVVDEDAKLKGSPQNLRASSYYPADVVLGDVFIVGEGPLRDDTGYASPDFIGLPPEFRDWPGPGAPYPEAARVALQNRI